MKVHIGPYQTDLIPVHRWTRNYEIMRYGGIVAEDEYKWYDKVIFNTLDFLDNLVSPINNWSNSRKRKIKVHIDHYDVWGADHTLALIILPTLKTLKKHKHGYPHIDSEDVPEVIRNMTCGAHMDGSLESDHEARWIWVLDEMIWAFEQYAADDDDAQFHHNVDQLETMFVPLEDNPKLSNLSFNYQKDPSKPAYWVDEEGKKKHHERKQNGLRLFAKYYECLWD